MSKRNVGVIRMRRVEWLTNNRERERERERERAREKGGFLVSQHDLHEIIAADV